MLKLFWQCDILCLSFYFFHKIIYHLHLLCGRVWVALHFSFLCCIVLLCFVCLRPVSCVPKDSILISTSVFYNVYCRARLTFYHWIFYLTANSNPSNRMKIIFHNCSCVAPNTKRIPFGIKLLIAILGWFNHRMILILWSNEKQKNSTFSKSNRKIVERSTIVHIIWLPIFRYWVYLVKVILEMRGATKFDITFLLIPLTQIHSHMLIS